MPIGIGLHDRKNFGPTGELLKRLEVGLEGLEGDLGPSGCRRDLIHGGHY
jgi:hypothetical protein